MVHERTDTSVQCPVSTIILIFFCNFNKAKLTFAKAGGRAMGGGGLIPVGIGGAGL